MVFNILNLDIVGLAKSTVQSSSLSQSRLNDRIELLQRAEESYYGNKGTDKQVNSLSFFSLTDLVNVLTESIVNWIYDTVNEFEGTNLQILPRGDAYLVNISNSVLPISIFYPHLAKRSCFPLI